MTGTLTLYAPLASRLGSLMFGALWIAIAGVFLLMFILKGQFEWELLIIFLFFAGIPALSALGALIPTTVVIDRRARTLAVMRQLLFLPISSTTLSFTDVSNVELQLAQTNSRNVWLINAVSRDDRRVTLNWDGQEAEMTDLAQRVAVIIGVPVSQGAYRLPAVLTRMLKKIAPEQVAKIEQIIGAQERASPPSDSDAPSITQPTIPQSIETPTVFESLSSEQHTRRERAADARRMTIESLEQRVASDSMDSDARYILARKYHARGEIDRAVTLYRAALRLDPTNTRAQNDLGVALQARGKRTEAEAAYRRAAALDPFSFTAHLNLALVLRSLNRAAEASQEFYLARQNARGADETRAAEAASTGARVEPRLSRG